MGQLAGHTGHTSVTLHSIPVCQLAENSWSHFGYSPFITRGSAGKAQLVTLLLHSTHHPWISWQITAGHTSLTLHSSPVDQLAEYSWSQFCYSPLITRGSAGRVQLVTLLLLFTYHPWISWQTTAGHTSVTLQSSLVFQLEEYTGHTSVTLHSSPVDQLAEHSWSHFCYFPVLTRVSAGRAHWSHFGYSPINTRVSAGRAQLVTLLLLSSQHPWISRQSTAGHTSVTLDSSPVDQLAEYSWSHFCYTPLMTRGSAGRLLLVTLRILSTHNPWISWLTTFGHTSDTLHSSPVDQLAKHSWSHFCYSPLITRGSADRVQMVTLRLLSTHHPRISWQSTAGHTSATLHS